MKWTKASTVAGTYYYGKRNNCRLAVHLYKQTGSYFFVVSIPNETTYVSTSDNHIYKEIGEAQIAAEFWVDKKYRNKIC